MPETLLMKPLIAITIGDAFGVGPEVAVRALADEAVRGAARFLLVGSAGIWEQARRRFVPELHFDTPAVSVLDVPAPDIDALPPDVPAEPDARTGRLAVAAIEKAVELALAGEVDAIVTAPINKKAIHDAGSRFPGHTEMLASLTGTSTPVMFFVAKAMRVALVTTHIALRAACDAITADAVTATARILDAALRRDFGLPAPRIAVCALNPHAGEAGLFGAEEQALDAAIRTLRDAGTNASGPYPSDTVFVRHLSGQFDAVLALYHDQAMIPVKLHGMEFGVNVTLGLPIIRTSPDHGTACDIAWQGRALPTSTAEAIKLAAAVAASRRGGS